jgi:hypothetical protein
MPPSTKFVAAGPASGLFKFRQKNCRRNSAEIQKKFRRNSGEILMKFRSI